MSDLFLDDNRPSLFAANALYLLCAAGLILLPYVTDPLVLLLHDWLPALSVDVLILLANALYYVPCALLPVLLYARSRGSWAAMRLSQPLAPSAAIRSAVAAILCVPLGADIAMLWYAALQALGLVIPESSIYIPTTSQGLLAAVFAMGVLPGVCEELAFRGMVLGAWERHSRRRALVVSSVLFASLHGSVSGLPTQLTLGLVIGMLALGSGSIYAGMIFHTLYNTLLLASQYMAQNLVSYTEEELALAELAQTDTLAYMGGAVGVISTCVQIVVLSALLLLVLRGLWKKRAPEPVLAQGERMGVQAFMMLMAGAATALYLYGKDILEMLGVSL